MPFDASIILGSKPIDTNQNALQQFLQLKQAKDQQQLNALAMQAHQLQIQQTQTGIEEEQGLRDLYQDNPNPSQQQILAKGGAHGIPYIKAQQEAALNQSTIGKNTAEAGKFKAEEGAKLTETQGMIADQTGLIALGLQKNGVNDATIAEAVQKLSVIDKAGAAHLAEAYRQGGPNAVMPLIGQAVQGSKAAQALVQKDTELQQTATHNKDEAGHWTNQDQTAQGQLQVAKQSADQTGRYQQGELRNSGILAGVAAQKERREQQKQDIELGGITPNAQAISDLNQPPPSNRNPLYNRTMIEVNQIRKAEGKPAYDATEWEMKQKTADDFASSGDSGKAATALNTLVRHSADMKNLIAKMDNHSFTPGNRLAQAIGQMTGHTAPTNFDQMKQYVVGETVKLIRGSGGSEADVKRAEESLNRAAAPEQLAGAMDINFEVAGGKMQAMNQVARRYMKKADFNVLDPEAGKLLDQMGYDTETLKRKPKQAAKPTLSKEDKALADRYHF
jgi:hypothetical protein